MTILGLVGDRPRDGKNPRVFLENIGAHTLLIGGRIGMGTPHSIERKIARLTIVAGGKNFLTRIWRSNIVIIR